MARHILVAAFFLAAQGAGPELRFAAQGGGTVPALAYGTAGVKDASTILKALQAGYRHIDTALIYGNHKAVAEALQRSGLRREEVFITSKVSFLPRLSFPWRWLFDAIYGQGAGFAALAGKLQERPAIWRSLDELGVSQIDLCLLHSPLQGGMLEFLATYLPHRLGRAKPTSWSLLRPLAPQVRGLFSWLLRTFGPAVSEGASARRRAWRALEAAQAAGECRYIGVSNFNSDLLEELLHGTSVSPAVNQIEQHVRFQARETEVYCKKNGIAVMAYGHGTSFESLGVMTVANATGLTRAQVSVLWALAHGSGAVVKSTRQEGMRENLQAKDLRLSEEHLAALDKWDEEEPFYWDPRAVPFQRHSPAEAPGRQEL